MKVHVPKLPAILINLSNVVHFKASQLLKMSVCTLPEQKEKNNSRGVLVRANKILTLLKLNYCSTGII